MTNETVPYLLVKGSEGYSPQQLSFTIDKEYLAESVILSGSFNPLHEGHIGMLKAAGEKTGR